MKRSVEILELTLEHPFATSHGVSVARRTALVGLEDDDGRVGYGEVAPYYGESVDDLVRELRDEREPTGPRARAALEIARLDLEAQARGVSVCELLGGDPRAGVVTSFTLGQASPDEVAKKAAAARGHHVLKLKVGTPHDEEAVRAVRAAHPSAILRADANGGYTEEEAPARIEMLARHGVELIEQPLPPGDPGALARLRAKSALPIFVDESIRDPEDVARHAGVVEGVVVKVGKCGGLRRTLACIAAARAAGLRVMVGCMIESSAGITAAASIASQCDLADLDGHLLITNDPFEGVAIDGDTLRLPGGAGLGLRRRG